MIYEHSTVSVIGLGWMHSEYITDMDADIFVSISRCGYLRYAG